LKAELYASDVYFREGWAALGERFGGQVAELARALALLLVKPDGLVSGKTGTILDFAAEHGFVATAFATPKLNGARWRELWRYQLNAATLDRLAVNDLIMPGGTLLLILRDERGSNLPASVRFQSLKGPSAIAAQPPDCLRKRLGQVTRTLSFVHCADEPVDVIRELAILLRGGDRDLVFPKLARSSLPQSERPELAKFAQRAPTDPFDRAKALQSLRGSLERSRLYRPDMNWLLEQVEAMEQGETINWRAFHRTLDECGIRVARWTLASVASHHIVTDEPGVAKLIPPLDHRLWL